MMDDFLIGCSVGLIAWGSITLYRWMRDIKQQNVFICFMVVIAFVMFIGVLAGIVETFFNSNLLVITVAGVVIPVLCLIGILSVETDVQTTEDISYSKSTLKKAEESAEKEFDRWLKDKHPGLWAYQSHKEFASFLLEKGISNEVFNAQKVKTLQEFGSWLIRTKRMNKTVSHKENKEINKGSLNEKPNKEKELRELKLLYEAGLLTKDVYEEKQRNILGIK